VAGIPLSERIAGLLESHHLFLSSSDTSWQPSLTFFLASQVPPSACQSRYTEAPATMAAIDSGAATLKQRFSLLLNCLFPLPNRNRMNPILLTNLGSVPKLLLGKLYYFSEFISINE
jgi:hypothetical protein